MNNDVLEDDLDEYGYYCTWAILDPNDEYICWYTECGEKQIFITDTLKDNNYRWCPYCGFPIIYG